MKWDVAFASKYTEAVRPRMTKMMGLASLGFAFALALTTVK
jgi:hypothetical protein